MRHAGLLFVALAAAVPSIRAASAAPVVDTTTPTTLSLDDALKQFHAHGYDLLIADASVYSAEADVALAGAIPNPTLGGNLPVVTDPGYSSSACPGCSKLGFGGSVTDNGALFDTLSNKRGLRLAVARRALSVAKFGRADVQRTLDLQLKQAYVAYATAHAAARFAKEVQAAAAKTVEVQKARAPGKLDDGALARIELAKLEADRQLDLANANVKIARLGLAFMLGYRDKVPELALPSEPTKYVVPAALANATEATLRNEAYEHRPDYAAAKAEKARAADSLALAKRLRFPDIQLAMQYLQVGTGQMAIQPPMVTFGVSVTLPAFYQYQGEIKKAETDVYVASVNAKKIDALIATDVATAYETWTTQRKIIERAEAEVLPRARKARDITEAQFVEGKVPLIDLLDAQRTYISVNQTYLGDLANYWGAIFALEQAVGRDLRK